MAMNRITVALCSQRVLLREWLCNNPRENMSREISCIGECPAWPRLPTFTTPPPTEHRSRINCQNNKLCHPLTADFPLLKPWQFAKVTGRVQGTRKWALSLASGYCTMTEHVRRCYSLQATVTRIWVLSVIPHETTAGLVVWVVRYQHVAHKI